MRTTQYLLILLVVASFIFLFGLGKMALTDPDETFYAQTAKEMLQAGEWATPLIFGSPQFEKPVLYYWLVMASYKIFGINEFAARIPSVVFGIAGIIGIYLLGRVLFSPVCGLLSGFIMATCVEYIVLSRACVTDIVLMVFILYCFLFFMLGWVNQKKMFFLASAAMAAFAVLTKGPIGVLIPAVVVLLYVFLSRQGKDLKNVPIVWSIILFLLICLPWYLCMTRIHGTAFIDEFFGFQNITRFLQPEHRIGVSPFYYIPVVIGGFFPWSLFLPLGAWYLYKYDDFVSPLKAHKLFLSVWFFAIFIFFSVSRTKLVTYIFPLFPVMAVVTGRFWEIFLAKTGRDRKLTRYMNISYSLFAASTVLGLVGIFSIIIRKYIQAFSGVVLVGAVFALGMVFSVVYFLKKNKLFSFGIIIVTVILSIVLSVDVILPVIEEFESSKAVSLTVKGLSGSREPIGGESDNRRGIAFYADKTDIVDVHPYPKLIDFLSRKERVWCIIQRKHFDQLKAHRPDLVLGPLSQVGKKVIISNKGWSEE